MILEQIDYPRLLSDPSVITRVTCIRSERETNTMADIDTDPWNVRQTQSDIVEDNESMDAGSLWELGVEKTCTVGFPYGLETRRQRAHSTPWFHPSEIQGGLLTHWTVSVYCLNHVCWSAIENKYSMVNKVITLRQIILFLILGAFHIKLVK